MKVGNTVRLLPGAIERNCTRPGSLVEGGLYAVQQMDDEGFVRLNGPATWVGKDDVEVLSSFGLQDIQNLQSILSQEIQARHEAQRRVVELQERVDQLERLSFEAIAALDG